MKINWSEKFAKKNWPLIAFLIIFILAVFLRSYKFDDWLFVKGDQTRDAQLVVNAYQGGPGNLPLLGPRAGGTMLRLGPAFYYFQYLSAVIFGRADAPTVAYPNLLFSILSIPLFYFFLKKFFGAYWPAVLTAVYAFSFLAIEYSRFAWNPNSIPFFNLLFFYSLLEIFDRNQKNKIRWVAVSAVAFAISTQLHFSSFIVLPIITVAFMIYRYKSWKEYINIKTISVFIGIILLFYLPVILSDWIMKGDNVREFWEAVGSKSSSQTLTKKITKDAYFFGQYYFRILSGYFDSKSDWFYALWIFILSALALGGALFRKETDENKKNFIIINILWFVGYFIVYIPLANSIDKPRFFLPMLMIPAIFLGFWAKFLERYKNPFIRYSIIVPITLSIGANLFGTLEWMRELYISQTGINNPKAMVLSAKKKTMWWNWWHFEKTAEYMASRCPNDQIYYVTSKGGNDYKESFRFALGRIDNSKNLASIVKNSPYYSDTCYFGLIASNAQMPAVISSDFNIEDLEQYGDIKIIKLVPKNATAIYHADDKAAIENANEVTEESSDAQTDEETSEGIAPDHTRVFWNEVSSRL